VGPGRAGGHPAGGLPPLLHHHTRLDVLRPLWRWVLASRRALREPSTRSRHHQAPSSQTSLADRQHRLEARCTRRRAADTRAPLSAAATAAPILVTHVTFSASHGKLGCSASAKCCTYLLQLPRCHTSLALLLFSRRLSLPTTAALCCPSEPFKPNSTPSVHAFPVPNFLACNHS
jgi:hypothetical protein